MSPRPLNFVVTMLAGAAMVAAPFGPALAWNGGGSHGSFGGGPGCGGITVNKPVSIYKPTTVNNTISIYKPVTVNKDVNIYKPVTVNKDINIYKPVTINKDVNIYKPVTITKTIDASKNITINKDVNINKSIVINKGGSASAEASAFASAMAQASANASASANVTVYGGGYYDFTTVNNHFGGEIGNIQAAGRCQMREASVVKAIHAVCVSPDGREFPASHMTADTWIDTSMEGEVMRCIPGAHLKVIIGDVMQSDQGMAGTFASGQVLECGEHEALRHFKDGMLKCAPAVPVPDCTERTNLRRYGTGDLFFSYRTSVCVDDRTASAPRDLDVTGMTLDGGVGEGGN